MLPLNGEGAPRCVNSRDAQGIVELASATVPHKTDQTETQAAPIRANITGSDQCRAEGYTVRAAAPILATCRWLIEVGHESPNGRRVMLGRPANSLDNVST